MLFESHVKFWLYPHPTDMRRSYDGLCGMIKNGMKESPLSGDCFVFINRRKTHIKILYFDRSGYAIWMKRLEQGQFQSPSYDTDKVLLDWTTLQLILEGIELDSVKKRKRFQLKSTS